MASSRLYQVFIDEFYSYEGGVCVECLGVEVGDCLGYFWGAEFSLVVKV